MKRTIEEGLMTTEIAVMNKEAVALAADSAATITRDENKKIYNANKLFMLSKTRPIGIMFYDNSEINLVPWETIVKLYRDISVKNFDTLVEYADHFLSFLTGTDNPFYDRMFPTIGQNATFSALVDSIFGTMSSEIDKQSKTVFAKNGKIEDTELKNIVNKVIQVHYDRSMKVKDLPTIPANYSNKLLKVYKKLIMESKDNAFKNLPLSKENLNQLMAISCNIITKERFYFRSGIVIAGFGDKEIFPSLISYTIDFIINNKLKYRQDKNIIINQINNAAIETFAQDETIDAFLFGVHPDYNSKIAEALLNLITVEIPGKLLDQCDELEEEKKKMLKAKMEESGNQTFKEFFDKIIKQCGLQFASIFGAVKYLPKEELGTMAESLVNLTSFKKRMSLEEAETVGGPCDVAVISKGDGFIWVKRKHYFRKELNPQFFRNYYEELNEKGEGCDEKEK